MDSQYKLLSELLSDQDVFITCPKTSLANYWGALPPPAPPVSTGLICRLLITWFHIRKTCNFSDSIAIVILNDFPSATGLQGVYPWGVEEAVAVLGTAGPGAEIICGALV